MTLLIVYLSNYALASNRFYSAILEMKCQLNFVALYSKKKKKEEAFLISASEFKD